MSSMSGCSVRFDSIRFGTICKQLLRFSRIFVNLLLWKLQRQQQEQQRECCKTLTMLTKSNLFIGNIYKIRTLKHRALAFIGRNETKTKHLRIFSFVCFWLGFFLALLQPAAFSSWLIWAFRSKVIVNAKCESFRSTHLPQPRVSDTQQRLCAAWQAIIMAPL